MNARVHMHQLLLRSSAPPTTSTLLKTNNDQPTIDAFRQLDDLVAQLELTEPHYIKCIKPNSAKAPAGWSSPLVIEQLRYSGVLEVGAGVGGV